MRNKVQMGVFLTKVVDIISAFAEPMMRTHHYMSTLGLFHLKIWGRGGPEANSQCVRPLLAKRSQCVRTPLAKRSQCVRGDDGRAILNAGGR